MFFFLKKTIRSGNGNFFPLVEVTIDVKHPIEIYLHSRNIISMHLSVSRMNTTTGILCLDGVGWLV